MAYPTAKWREVACPTCHAGAGQKCHILGDLNAPLSKPHDGRVRLVDPEHSSLRPQKEDEFGNRILEDAKIVGKCVVKVQGQGRQNAVWHFPEHEPGHRMVGSPHGAPLYECQRCGAIVLKKEKQ